MNATAVFDDAFGRVRDLTARAVTDLSAADAAYRPDPGANSIAWLVWHLTRVQDDHVAELAGVEQAWTAAGWVGRFGLPFTPEDTGYGHSVEQVGQVQPDDVSLLSEYHEDVAGRTATYLAGVGPEDLDRVIDDSWDPPVTVGIRLVSVVSDNLQHVGQAHYVRGIIERR